MKVSDEVSGFFKMKNAPNMYRFLIFEIEREKQIPVMIKKR